MRGIDRHLTQHISKTTTKTKISLLLHPFFRGAIMPPLAHRKPFEPVENQVENE
jgi:hypothetical protein